MFDCPKKKRYQDILSFGAVSSLGILQNKMLSFFMFGSARVDLIK